MNFLHKPSSKNTYTITIVAYFESVTTNPYSQASKLLKTHQENPHMY